MKIIYVSLIFTCVLAISGNVIAANIFTHFVTFEDRIWSSSYPLIYPWAGTNRDLVEHADERAAFFSVENMCVLSTEWSRYGAYSAKCTSATEGIKGRRMLELVGNTPDGINRKLRYDTEYWLGFSIRNLEPILQTGWELYFQLHNNSTPPTGWGSTNNPMVAIERDGDNFYKILYRYNTSDGDVVTQSQQLGAVAVDETSDFVIHIRLSNPSSNGLIDVWQKNSTDAEFIQYLSVADINVGYYRPDPTQGPTLSSGIYNGPTGVIGRTVYIDNVFVSDDPAFIFTDILPDGDLNADSVVNAADVVLAYQFLMDQLMMTSEQMSHGDVAPLVDGMPVPDGIFNAADLLLIQRKTLGQINF